MGTMPVAADIRAYLEGYCTDANIISDGFITDQLTNYVIPYIERATRQSFSGVNTYEEYCSGNGTNILFLSRRPIVSLVQVRYILGGDNQRVLSLANIELLGAEGILKAKRNAVETWIMPVFPKGDKNMAVQYTAGWAVGNIPSDINFAAKLLACSMALTMIEGRAGGGDIGIQGYNKSYGRRGRYTYVRSEMERQANHILRKYITTVVGS